MSISNSQNEYILHYSTTITFEESMLQFNKQAQLHYNTKEELRKLINAFKVMKRVRKIEELIKKMVKKKNKPDAVIVEKIRKLTVITSMRQHNCI